MNQPVKFVIDDKRGNKASGTIDFGLQIKIMVDKSPRINIWKPDIVTRDVAILTDFECEHFYYEDCHTIKEFVTKNLIEDLFAFYQKDLHHFDQPFAYLSAKGFLDYINVYS